MEDIREPSPEVMENLKHPDPHIRREAVTRLSETPTVAAIQALIERLRDADAEVREAASDALTRIGTPKIVMRLSQAPRDPVTWAGVARTLAKIGTPEAIKVLAEALHDSSAEVWSTASLALADAGPAAGEALIGALQHEVPSVRARAAMALGRARVVAATEALIAALKDSDRSVRLEAVVALAALRQDAAVPALVEALNDSEESVRQSVPIALGEIGTEAALKALKEAAQHEDEGIRWVAQWQLQEMGVEQEPNFDLS